VLAELCDFGQVLLRLFLVSQREHELHCLLVGLLELSEREGRLAFNAGPRGLKDIAERYQRQSPVNPPSAAGKLRDLLGHNQAAPGKRSRIVQQHLVAAAGGLGECLNVSRALSSQRVLNLYLHQRFRVLLEAVQCVDVEPRQFVGNPAAPGLHAFRHGEPDANSTLNIHIDH
jgi:hypothetical protein